MNKEAEADFKVGGDMRYEYRFTEYDNVFKK